MRMPDGSIVKLLKSLHSPKQAVHKFKDPFDETLTAMGCRRLSCDASVYLGFHKGNKIMFTSHVGDLLFLSTGMDNTQKVFNELPKTYSTTFQANATKYLGYTITRR